MKNKILLVLGALFGLMMVNSGLNKFFYYMPMPEPTPEQIELIGAFVKLGWIMPLVAVVEIVGGALFAIPKYRTLGAIIILPVMVGIVAHHAVHDPAGLVIPGVMLAINLWALMDGKDKWMSLAR